jgi:ribose/xylose/arabinose/galactoside ABC-type transport system permease subunit
VQGQGKADLATGYELDIIASAVVGGASLSGGRGPVLGAVLGTLIFGVLRNALPQIPGATFYDRLIVGLAVIVIVVMDQLLARRGRQRRTHCGAFDRAPFSASCSLSRAAAAVAAGPRNTASR